jgi:hypothetical protein
MGFPRDNLGAYLSGESRELMDNYPELGLLRDVVYTLKLMMAPTGDGLPDVKCWKPLDAALHWTFKSKG